MSDRRNVKTDTEHDGAVMNTALREANFFLNELTRKQHRGRGDTLTAARDRAAQAAGISRSYAKRIWDRVESMGDVSGEAYRLLKLAYHATCDRIEASAAAMEDETDKLKAERHAADQAARPMVASVESAPR